MGLLDDMNRMGPSSIFTFGKYKGMSLEDVVRVDGKYVTYLIENKIINITDKVKLVDVSKRKFFIPYFIRNTEEIKVVCVEAETDVEALTKLLVELTGHTLESSYSISELEKFASSYSIVMGTVKLLEEVYDAII